MAESPFHDLSIMDFAAALLDGPWTKREILERAKQVCDVPLPLLRRLVRRIISHAPQTRFRLDQPADA